MEMTDQQEADCRRERKNGAAAFTLRSSPFGGMGICRTEGKRMWLLLSKSYLWIQVEKPEADYS